MRLRAYMAVTCDWDLHSVEREREVCVFWPHAMAAQLGGNWKAGFPSLAVAGYACGRTRSARSLSPASKAPPTDPRSQGIKRKETQGGPRAINERPSEENPRQNARACIYVQNGCAAAEHAQYYHVYSATPWILLLAC